MLKKSALLVSPVVLTLVMSFVAMADPTPEDAKSYRESVMTTLRGHIGAASMHVRGLVDDNGFLTAHAEGLANGAAELKFVFPAGSDIDDSEALPAIWEQPEDFNEALENVEQATAAFRDAVAGGDKETISAAFREVGASCRGCHDQFRLDTD